jgi:nitronate monooxygenase
VSGRAIANQFSRRWHGNEDALRAWVRDHGDEYLALGPESDVDQQAVWAGEATSLVTGVERAPDIVDRLVREATEILSHRPNLLLQQRSRRQRS